MEKWDRIVIRNGNPVMLGANKNEEGMNFAAGGSGRGQRRSGSVPERQRSSMQRDSFYRTHGKGMYHAGFRAEH